MIDSYTPISLENVPPDHNLPVGIYLKINQKCIKFKPAGEEIPSIKYNFFLSKNVKELFVVNEDYPIMQKWIDEMSRKDTDALVRETGGEHRDVVLKYEEIKRQVIRTFSPEELNEKNVNILRDQTQELIKEIKHQDLSAMLAQMTKFSGSIADHSINVAGIAVFMAMVVGYDDPDILVLLYMGGLFHDYGKIKVDPKIIDKKAGPAYIKAYAHHPRRGFEYLSKMNAIPEEVALICKQHHECYSGGGFPDGLKGEQIDKLSQIVSIASCFDNSVSEHARTSGNKLTGFKRAFSTLEYDKGKQFDPALIHQILGPLKRAINQEQEASKIYKAGQITGQE